LVQRKTKREREREKKRETHDLLTRRHTGHRHTQRRADANMQTHIHKGTWIDADTHKKRKKKKKNNVRYRTVIYGCLCRYV